MPSKPFVDPTNPVRSTQAESRAAARLREQQLREARETALREQTAAHNDPSQRIAAWERLHDLSLPKHPGHPLIAVIARETQLAIAQVLDEQRRRLDQAAARRP
ncbi:MAG: hypothetical protein C0P74_002150 [Gammaproteobacteria bacterium]